jgi:DNA-binding CsgD family transcriptional regulator
VSISIPSSRVRGLLNLVGELREITGAGQDPSQHFAKGAMALLGGDAGGVVFGPKAMTTNDGLKRMVMVGFSETEVPNIQRLYITESGVTADPAAVASMRNFPEPNIGRRRDLVDDRAWYGSDYVNDHRRAWRLDDSIYSSAVKPDTTMAGIGVFRAWGARAYSVEDRELAHLLIDATLMLLPSPEGVRLSPREDETLQHLLQGESSKEIASALQLSVHTVNEYIHGIYRAYGVRSRGELFAKVRRK